MLLYIRCGQPLPPCSAPPKPPKAFFFKKKSNKFPIEAENQYICTPIDFGEIKFYNNINKNKEMTKAEIINKIVEDTGVDKNAVSATIEAFMEEVRQSLAVKKENVYLRGFGSFTVKRRAQKTARNISKNTTIIIEAHDYPAFKPAKSFIAKMK